ncbi:MAG: hypothetical protein ACK5TE_03855, partial [Pseudomonadota bacterium]
MDEAAGASVADAAGASAAVPAAPAERAEDDGPHPADTSGDDAESAEAPIAADGGADAGMASGRGSAARVRDAAGLP